MNRLKGILSWRHLRWVACAAVIPALWACNARKLAPPTGGPAQIIKNRFQQSVNRDLDLLFLIDDSNSMAPLQAKMRARMPDFMDVLKGLPGGLPNLHVAVVSSSLGAGVFGNVTGCQQRTSGNLEGLFQHKSGCGLNDGETFIKSLPGMNGQRVENFTGDITNVFSCIADLGQNGCGFEHQLESVRYSLQRALQPGDPNYGFIRDTAYLAVVMLTNEDDCSVDPTSTLFDPGMTTTADMLGGLQSYRCNEFGHKCSAALPHTAPMPAMTMTDCKSAEDGKLVRVKEYVDFMRALKPEDQILLAAIQGPVTPYVVDSKAFMLANGGTENQPYVQHSCTSGNAGTEYADPGVRIKEFMEPFNGVIESICENDFRDAMVRIAQVISAKLGAQCVANNVARKGNGEFDCDVTQRQVSATGQNVDKAVPACQGAAPNITNASTDQPCWVLVDGANGQCNGQKILNVCYDAGCTAGAKPQTKTDAIVACALEE